MPCQTRSLAITSTYSCRVRQVDRTARHGRRAAGRRGLVKFTLLSEIEKHTTFTQFLKPRELIDFYQQTTLFVFPSKTERLQKSGLIAILPGLQQGYCWESTTSTPQRTTQAPSEAVIHHGRS